MKPLVIVTPPNQRFSADGASAINLNVRDAVRHSRYRDRMVVIGPAVDTPFDDIAFEALPRTDDAGSYAASVLAVIRRLDPALVELRQHMRVAERVGRGLGPKTPTLLFRHKQMKSPALGLERAYRSWRLRPFDRIAFVSDFARAQFARDYPKAAARAVTAHNGLDTEVFRFEPLRKQKLIVFAGRVIPTKGVLDFVQGAGKVVRRHPDWKLVVVGAPDPGFETYGAAVAKAVEELGPQGELTGYRPFEAAMDYFARAGIAVVPSRWEETFGRTAMEAMALGAALVSSGRGGLREVSGEAALYLDKIHPDTIETAVRRLVEDEALRHRLQVEARARVEDIFDIRRTVAHIDDLRAELLGDEA